MCVYIYMYIYQLEDPITFRLIPWRDPHGILVLYDITNMHSFSYLPSWFESAKRISPDSCKFMLIGTKKDLSDQGRVVSVEMGQRLADQWGIAFREVSAKTGEGIQETVELLTEEILTGSQRFGCCPLPLHVPSKDAIARGVALYYSFKDSKNNNNNYNDNDNNNNSSCQLQ